MTSIIDEKAAGPKQVKHVEGRSRTIKNWPEDLEDFLKMRTHIKG